MRGFILVTFLVEKAAVPGIKAILQAIRAVRQLDEETLHQALQGLATAIGAMGKALQRMHGNSSLQEPAGQPAPSGCRAWGCSPGALRECARAWPREQLIKALPVGNADADCPQ